MPVEVYCGERDEEEVFGIWAGEGCAKADLDPRDDLNHFSDDFGCGPREILGGLQAAQAILSDALQNDLLVRAWTVEFWRHCIARQEESGFALLRKDIVQWVVDAVTAELTGTPWPTLKGEENG